MSLLERFLGLSAVLGALAVLLFALENLVPLRRRRMRLLTRLVANLALSALAYAAAGTLVRPLAVTLLGWTETERFGLGHLIRLPWPGVPVLCFLLMDLTFYYWHRANHRIPVLWRFHAVHHIDPDLDVSTALRFHFGEVALSAGLRLVQVTAIGIDVATYAVYEIAFQANTLFHHSNMRLPLRLERWLNALLVTPRMHGIHHSEVREETDSNYSVVLPWWDRLHRTLCLNVPQSQLTIGVPAYSEPEDQRLTRLLAMPFRRPRDYWRRPDGSVVKRDPAAVSGNPHRMVD